MIPSQKSRFRICSRRWLHSVLIASCFAISIPVAAQSSVDAPSSSKPETEARTNPTNREVIRLTNDGRLKHDPVFFDNGNQIAYTSLEKFNQLCLMKLNLVDQDSKPARFHPSASTSELLVSFADDEKQYAYLRNNGNLHFEVIFENQNNGKTVKYNPGGGFAGVRNLSLSPDGTNLVFAFANQNGPQQIYSLTRDDLKVLPLSDSNGINISPSYSPDGKSIAFSSSRDGDFDIFVMKQDGSAPRNLTRNKGLETHPAWSPDGKKIAFTRLHQGNYDIYMMNADGTKLTRLTNSEEVDDYPCWHPNGKSIVWVGERNGKRDLYQMPASRK